KLLTGGSHFILRALSLLSQQRTTATYQRHTHRNQFAQACDSPSSDRLGLQTSMQLFPTGTMHRDVIQIEFCAHLLQPVHTALHRFDQVEFQICAHRRKHNSWKTGSSTHIGHRSPGGEEPSHGRRIQHMPGPQARKFAGTDQTTKLTLVLEHASELRRTAPAQSEYLLAARIINCNPAGTVRILHQLPQSAGWMTTFRSGSSPSESLTRPAAATTSCTTLRSKGFIGAIATASPDSRTFSIASAAAVCSSSLRFLRNPATSSISRLRCPVLVCTARRVSSCRESSTSARLPTSRSRQLSSSSATTATAARPFSTSMSMSPSKSAISSNSS